MRARLVSACVVASLAGFSPAVSAEPVRITGGLGNIGTDITGFVMTAPGTSISLTVRGSFLPVDFFPGDVVSFVATAAPEDFSTFGFPVTLDGVDHGNLFFQGQMTFVTDSVIAPPVTSPSHTFTAAGTLSGTLTAFGTSDFSAAPLLALDVAGHGMFTSVFWAIGPFEHPDHWFGGIEPSAQIQFTDAASTSATPEPASLLLLATGAAAFCARRRANS